MLGNHLPQFLWGEETFTAIHIINRMPTKAVEGMTPYQVWHGKKSNLAHLRIFGCVAYALIPYEKKKKLDAKSENCIFVGYDSEHKGYRLYTPSSHSIFISRDVEFLEEPIEVDME